MRLADLDLSPASLADAIICASQQAHRHGVGPHVYFMNATDYADITDCIDYSDAEMTIRASGGTYQAITTRLGQMSVARRLSARRGRRFRALEWLNP